MPRQTRKKTLLNPQKSQLLFLEQPRNGESHDYGRQLRRAINPRSFTTTEEPQQGLTVSSWVSSQFTSLDLTAVRRSGHGKKRNQLPTSMMNATSRRTCKYHALSFETSASLPQGHRNVACKKTVSSCAEETQKAPNVSRSRGDGGKLVSPSSKNEVPPETREQIPHDTIRQQETTTEATPIPFRASEIVKTPLSFTVGRLGALGSVHTSDSSAVFIPSHIDTPEISHSEHGHSSSTLHLLFSPDQPTSPPRTQSSGLLVKDTPERDYGLKVTWKRRKNLMKLLIKRGQLLVSGAMISNES